MESGDREDGKEEISTHHKTKVVQFLGRNTPIVLQNDNGPCPLLAICNVLLLRNNLNLSSDVAEVSQEKLLSLVAERLIDSNSNVDDKDVGYVENQQQNISDAIDLLPRLTTGIDVNLKFTRTDDFEFTRECAIFDLLDIPLYHGWIVDPQDSDTADAIGLKSYNTLMGDLVALETHNQESELKNPEEDVVDFVAATTASLGVPSPCMSKTKSFDEKKERKGDLEEERELLIALRLSETKNDIKVDDIVENNSSEKSNDQSLQKQEPEDDGKVDNTVKNNSSENPTGPSLIIQEPENDGIVDDTVKNNSSKNLNDPSLEKQIPENDMLTLPTDQVQGVSSSLQDKLHDQTEAASEKHDMLVKLEKAMVDGQGDSVLAPPANTLVYNLQDQQIQDQSVKGNDVNLQSVEGNNVNKQSVEGDDVNAQLVEGNGENIHSSNGLTQSTDESKSVCLDESVDGSEPIYEGEERILETSTADYEDGEPMYEGEVALAEQVDKVSSIADEAKGKDGITPKQGELIKNFLKNSANQLTIFGLFSLQEGLKERELCVFFRNNHFNTMFKFEGELYLLATDQGYINQPDLVWEKLNEVNGDTIYMTGSFKEFNAENPETRSWDEQNALATTAEYIASIDNAAQENTNFNSDLQLAIALQQQEFEQQQQQSQAQQPTQHNLPQPIAVGGSGLVTGPQHVQPSRPRNSSSSSKQESKSSKDRCNLM